MSTNFFEHKLDFPSRFVDLKQQIVPARDHGTQKEFVAAWRDLLKELAASTKLFKDRGSELIPQVDFQDLRRLSPEIVADIKRRGCVVIRNVVDDEEALGWKQSIKDYISANPSFPGLPEGSDNKDFYFMSWSKAQIQARSHPNVLDSQKWLNSLYHVTEARDGVSLETPLAYADRLRLRDPGPLTMSICVPHVDGGGIERWEDPGFRTVYAHIMEGRWRSHDPYNLDARLHVNSRMYNTPSQASAFRTFQGWLSMSDTGPGEGTLQVFPDVVLSTAYIMLRPFFGPITGFVSDDPLVPDNWEFDTSSPDFPGIYPVDDYFTHPLLTKESHPHLKLDECMISMPHVNPGDMVFWHCDVVHAVEKEHHGTGDSSVIYIPAMPETPVNAAYVDRQKEHFQRWAPPPDFPQDEGEAGFLFVGSEKDIVNPEGRRAMGFST